MKKEQLEKAILDEVENGKDYDCEELKPIFENIREFAFLNDESKELLITILSIFWKGGRKGN